MDAVCLKLRPRNEQSDAAYQVCGKRVAPIGLYALCCAPGPSRDGHNEVHEYVHFVSRQSNVSAESKVAGILSVAPGCHLADDRTFRTGGVGFAAMNVGAAGPESQAAVAHAEALEAMQAR